MSVVLNTLYVTQADAYLKLERETLCVMVEGKKRLQIPLRHLGSLVLFDHVMVSPALMGRCMEDGRCIVWLDRSGGFKARVEGAVSGNVLLRQVQYRTMEDSARCLELARRFIAGKLRNSRQILLRAARESTDGGEKAELVQTAQVIAHQIRKLPNAGDADQVRGLEGDGARRYFEQFSRLIKPKPRRHFSFDARNRRPPRDPVNALLSFLYALVLNDCRSALETVGLDPQAGFFHILRPGRPALALDLQEEFRAPLADRLALTLINRGQIKPSHFEQFTNGAVLLNDEGRKLVITAYQKRKQETLIHPLLEQSVPVGLLCHIQARLLARYLRGDLDEYVPYLQR